MRVDGWRLTRVLVIALPLSWSAPPSATAADVGPTRVPEPMAAERRLDLGCFGPGAASSLGQVEPAPLDPSAQYERAMATATADAKEDVSGAAWLALGCVFTIYAVIAAYTLDPDPSWHRLAGKSPEYVTMYSATWRKRAKSRRQKHAWIGTAVGFVVALALVSQIHSGRPNDAQPPSP